MTKGVGLDVIYIYTKDSLVLNSYPSEHQLGVIPNLEEIPRQSNTPGDDPHIPDVEMDVVRRNR